MQSESFGLEIVFASVKADLRDDSDALVTAVHWCLIKKGFKCVGKGETKPVSTAGLQQSELLPAGWSIDGGVYCLQYLRGEDVYLLKVIRMDGTLLIHLMRYRDDKVGDTSISVTDFCSEDLTSYHTAYKNISGLQKQIDTEVLAVFEEKHKPAPVARAQDQNRGSEAGNSRDHDPLRVRNPRNDHRAPHWRDPLADPFSVGRADLDPLAGPGAGGMLMDPSRGGLGGPLGGGGMAGPGRLPHGGVPPGARFDPMFPPDLDGSGSRHPRGGHPRAGPDPDHMRPPGFDDNMFM